MPYKLRASAFFFNYTVTLHAYDSDPVSKSGLSSFCPFSPWIWQSAYTPYQKRHRQHILPEQRASLSVMISSALFTWTTSRKKKLL